IDVKALMAKKEEIRNRLNTLYRENQAANRATREAWEAEKKAIDDEVTAFNNELEESRKFRLMMTDLRDRLQTYRLNVPDFDNLVDFSGLREQIGQWIKEGPREPKIAADLYPKAPTN